jgi:arylamine N-acetyltransferase
MEVVSNATTLRNCYLERIGLPAYSAEAYPRTLQTLHKIRDAHVKHVPFESLSVERGTITFDLDIEKFLRKIVFLKRGGFCFELNGCCAWLLRSMGFVVQLYSARVWRPATGFGRPNAHLCLAVVAEGTSYLFDVGFSSNAIGPLCFHEREQHDMLLRRLQPGDMNADGEPVPAAADDGSASVSDDAFPPPGQLWRVMCVVPRAEAQLQPRADAPVAGEPTLHGTAHALNLQYEFGTTPQQFRVFADMCAFHQSNPASSYQRGTVCARWLPGGGRLTLGSGVWSGADAASTVFTLCRRRDAQAARETLATVEAGPAVDALLWEHFALRVGLPGPTVTLAPADRFEL